MRFRPLLSFFGLLIFLLPIGSIIAQDKPKTEDEQDTIRLRTELVSIDVNVTDRTGARVAYPLRAEDFVVYENGVRQTISNFSLTETPFNLVLLIDTSGSTSENLNLIRRAARKFLDELRPKDKVAVVSFHKQIELLEDLTTDRTQIEAALDRLPTGSGGAFYDALQLSVDDALKNAQGRKAVIALTDGVDSTGTFTYEKLLPEIESAGAVLYFLEVNTEAFTEAGMMRSCFDETHFEFSRKQLKKFHAANKQKGLEFGTHCVIPPTERQQMNRALYEMARREMRELAERTGGDVYPVRDLQQLAPAYAQIAEALRKFYSIGYYPANDKRDGAWRKLRVEIKIPGLKARTRPGYRAPRD
jgi:VWFA-related protein